MILTMISIIITAILTLLLLLLLLFSLTMILLILVSISAPRRSSAGQGRPLVQKKPRIRRHLCVRGGIYIYIYIYIYICMYMRCCMYVCMYAYVYVYVCMYVSVLVLQRGCAVLSCTPSYCIETRKSALVMDCTPPLYDAVMYCISLVLSRGNHLSNTSCLTQVFFRSGE